VIESSLPNRLFKEAALSLFHLLLPLCYTASLARDRKRGGWDDSTNYDPLPFLTIFTATPAVAIAISDKGKPWGVGLRATPL